MTRADAIIDETHQYRYSLTREWSSLRRVVWIMLNPSTADARQDDPTIRKCVGFARKWGYGGIEVVNLFAYRATNPNALAKFSQPIGLDNDFYIRRAVNNNAGLVIPAWGANPFAKDRVLPVHRLLFEVKEIIRCLGITKSGAPRHPLYVPYDTRLKVYDPR